MAEHPPFPVYRFSNVDLSVDFVFKHVDTTPLLRTFFGIAGNDCGCYLLHAYL